MKTFKYITAAVLALAGLLSCDKNTIESDTTPEVSLSTSYTEFESGMAAVEMRLSHFIHSDVKAVISVEGIEDDAVKFDPVVTVPAGAIKTNIALTLDGKKVELHKDYTVTVKVKSVEGAKLTSAASVSLNARVDEVRKWEFSPNAVSTWNPYPYAPSGYNYCWIYIYSAPEWFQIDIFPYDEGDMADPVFLLKKMDAFADYVNELYETYKDVYSAKTDVLCHYTGSNMYASYKTGTSSTYVGTGEEGRYWLLMMEFDTDLVPTGNYKTVAFTYSN
mgnify:CR=1 FL=1